MAYEIAKLVVQSFSAAFYPVKDIISYFNDKAKYVRDLENNLTKLVAEMTTLYSKKKQIDRILATSASKEKSGEYYLLVDEIQAFRIKYNRFTKKYNKHCNNLPNEIPELALTESKAIGQKQIAMPETDALIANNVIDPLQSRKPTILTRKFFKLAQLSIDINKLHDHISRVTGRMKLDMEISAASFRNLLQNISKAVGVKESAIDYANFLQEIFEEKETYDDKALANSEIQSQVGVQTLDILFGRENEVEQLLSKLLDPGERGTQLSVIPIFGERGIGKTSLARIVYDNTVVKEYFEVRAWVKVEGEEFKLQHAAQQILKSTLGMSCSFDDLDELDEMVRDALHSQRCLIVFDGIESMAIDILLHMNRNWFDFVDLGSKVLITTPSIDVVVIVANQPFELKPLSQDIGWFLCRYLAFNSSAGVKDMSRPMAENLASLCRGVPLLLKLVGSLIRYDHKIRDLLSLVDFSDDILQPTSVASVAILLCVWALPSKLRQCFAYCALFPKGCALSKDKIIDMWITSGLVMPSPGNNSLEDIGNTYFLQLLYKSFFTDITRDQYGDIIEFRIPGLIHEMGKHVARIVYKEKLGLIGSIGEDAGQISLILPFSEKYISKDLQILILSPVLCLAGSLDRSLLDFQGLQSLDLSCSGIQKLSDDVCALRELTYLNLSYTFIERLPDAIMGLLRLKTLDLSWCHHLKVLPKGISELLHMRRLDLSRCDSLSYLPPGINFLRFLTSMPLFVLGKGDECAHLGELGHLNQLMGRLEIRNLENVREILEASNTGLDLKYLQHLGLAWSENADHCFEVLELLQPNSHLKTLDITGYMGHRFPRWLSSIYGLIKISITNCACEELPSLGKLPFLKELHLNRMMNLEFIGQEFYGFDDMLFVSLEQLQLYDLPNLSEWSSAIIPNASIGSVLPSLKTLTVKGCPKLRSVPCLPTLPDLILNNSNNMILDSLPSFTSLSSLLINDMELEQGLPFWDFPRLESLKKLIICNIKDDDFSFFEKTSLTALNYLGILHCHEITRLYLNFSPSLQKLHIVDCPDLRSFSLMEDVENQLVELVVEDCPRIFYEISFHNFHHLRKLVLKNCGDGFRIHYSEELKKIEKLEYLLVSGCPRLESDLQAFPWLISHIPLAIVGNQKANFKDMKDLREDPIFVSCEPKSEVMVPSPDRFSHGPQKFTTMQYMCNVMAIEYKEIEKATKNFGSDLLGEGGFGTVYKGWIDEHSFTAVKPGSGTAVAVKKWSPESTQGDEAWSNEVKYLGQLRHPNLVKLIGYCIEKENRILVYEFMPKGSLFNHLFPRGHQCLPWATRINVAVGAARGLSFLHDLETPVIHRNVKSGDILLDDEFNAKLSDFGQAQDGPTDGMSHVSTPVMGTYGYAAPEYISTGFLSTKSDVYGFGVVLLELLSGLKAIDRSRPVEKQSLVDWAKPYLGNKRKISRIVDSKLKGEYVIKEAYTVSKLAKQCLSSDPKERPRMNEVVVALEQLHRPKPF